MKRLLFFALLISSLSGLVSCASGANNDAKLIDSYFREYYSQKFEIDSYKYSEYTTDNLTSSTIPNLKNMYNVDYFYSCPNGDIDISSSAGYGGTMVIFKVSPDALATDYVDIPINVSVSVDCGYNASFTKIFRYKPYTSYFGNILAEDQKISSKFIENKNNVSLIYNQYITSGHFYTNYSYEIDFNKKTFVYNCTKYEKDLYGTYNVQEYEACYFFGDNNPRIEGLTTGTFFVDGSSYNSENSYDLSAYSYSVAINNLFKKYNDNRYITNIS